MNYCDNPACTAHCEILTVNGKIHWKNGFGGEVGRLFSRHEVKSGNQTLFLCHKCVAVYEMVSPRIQELEAAIRKHRQATSHDMCWENDVELWGVLKDSPKMDHTPPPWCEFMQRCAAYRASKDVCGTATITTPSDLDQKKNKIVAAADTQAQ